MTCDPDWRVALCTADAGLYGAAALALLPDGPAWPKEDGTALHALYAGVIGEVLHAMAARGCAILPEIDPCTAIETVPRWFAIYGGDQCEVHPCLPAEEVLADLCLRARLAQTGQPPDILALAADLGFAAHWEACAPVWSLAVQPVCDMPLGTAGQNMSQVLVLSDGPARITQTLCEMRIGVPWCWRPGLAALRCITEIFRPAHVLRRVEDRID